MLTTFAWHLQLRVKYVLSQHPAPDVARDSILIVACLSTAHQVTQEKAFPKYPALRQFLRAIAVGYDLISMEGPDVGKVETYILSWFQHNPSSISRAGGSPRTGGFLSNSERKEADFSS